MALVHILYLTFHKSRKVFKTDGCRRGSHLGALVHISYLKFHKSRKRFKTDGCRTKRKKSPRSLCFLFAYILCLKKITHRVSVSKLTAERVNSLRLFAFRIFAVRVSKRFPMMKRRLPQYLARSFHILNFIHRVNISKPFRMRANVSWVPTSSSPRPLPSLCLSKKKKEGNYTMFVSRGRLSIRGLMRRRTQVASYHQRVVEHYGTYRFGVYYMYIYIYTNIPDPPRRRRREADGRLSE